MENTETAINLQEQLEALYNTMTEGDRDFVNQYLSNGFNATEAVSKTFHKDNYSDSYKRLKGHLILGREPVKKYLDVYFKLQRETSERKIDKLISELEEFAFNKNIPKAEVPLKAKAWDILAKHYGMEKNTLDITSGGKALNIKVEYI